MGISFSWIYLLSHSSSSHQLIPGPHIDQVIGEHRHAKGNDFTVFHGGQWKVSGLYVI